MTNEELKKHIEDIWRNIQDVMRDQPQVYSSEKALCFNFAWMMKEKYGDKVQLDFEVPIFDKVSDGRYLDLLVEWKEKPLKKVGIEFKFPKSSNNGNTNQTQTRIKIINDIKRLTWLVKNKKIDLGCFLCVTDQLPYINEGKKEKSLDFKTYQQTQYLKDHMFPVETSSSCEEVYSINHITFNWINIKKVRMKYVICDDTYAWVEPIFICRSNNKET